MIITLAILAVTVVLLARGTFRSDMVAMCALLSLVLTGILTPQEAFSGFSNTVIFVMAGMFVISGAIVRTGLAGIVSNRILGVVGKNTHVLYMAVMILTALIGSLVSNTGTVAIMMPIVVSLSLTIDESPARFLMPLAFMSSIGGMFTLIGNSPNMVVNAAYVDAGYPSLTLLSFFPVGVVCFLFGVFVLAPFTSFYLARRKNARDEPRPNRFSMRELAAKYQLADNIYMLEVTGESDATGRRLEELGFPEKYGIVVTEILRTEPATGYFGHARTRCLLPGPQTVLQPGDMLRIIGSITGVTVMADGENFCMVSTNLAEEDEEGDASSVGICELVLMSSSRLIRRTVFESGLRQQFGITVLGIQRGSQYILENIKDQEMQAGDALLVEGSWEDLRRLDDYSMNWVVVGRPGEGVKAGKLVEKIPLVVAVLALMLAAMAFNVIPTVAAVMIAAVTLVLGGCFKNMDEVYSVMGWETMVMLACLLSTAVAMEKVGMVDLIAGRMMTLCADYGPHVALAVIYGITSALNIVISTTPVALLVAPIALELALSLGYSPLPFLFAVATASSMCFASPFSTPPNALVMSAGRYTFADYVKVGLPMQVLMGVVMVVALPLLFPFSAVS